MVDMDVQSYLANKMKTTGADSVSKGGVTLERSIPGVSPGWGGYHNSYPSQGNPQGAHMGSQSSTPDTGQHY